MITLSNISQQHGRQIPFLEASMQLNPGEKVGLVGPNGAGKSTLFRIIAGEEEPTEGQVSIPKRLTIGLFRQDTAEMSGRTVLRVPPFSPVGLWRRREPNLARTETRTGSWRAPCATARCRDAF